MNHRIWWHIFGTAAIYKELGREQRCKPHLGLGNLKSVLWGQGPCHWEHRSHGSHQNLRRGGSSPVLWEPAHGQREAMLARGLRLKAHEALCILDTGLRWELSVIVLRPECWGLVGRLTAATMIVVQSQWLQQSERKTAEGGKKEGRVRPIGQYQSSA